MTASRAVATLRARVAAKRWQTYDEARALGLDRFQLGKLLQVASASSPSDGALFALMGLIGLRVSEACMCRSKTFRTRFAGTARFGVGALPGTEIVSIRNLYILRFLITVSRIV